MTAPYFISHQQHYNNSAQHHDNNSAPEVSEHGPIRVQPVRHASGRPGGKCKCCGKLGSYTKTCGLKHVCEIGKCAINILQTYDAPPPPEKNSFEVACACCKKPLRFTVQGAGSAEIVCYGCGFTMRSMAKEIPGEESGSECEADEESSDADSTDTVPMATAETQEGTRKRKQLTSCGDKNVHKLPPNSMPATMVYAHQGDKASTQCVRCQRRLEFEATAHCSILQCCECDCKMLYQPHTSTDAPRPRSASGSSVAVEHAV